MKHGKILKLKLFSFLMVFAMLLLSAFYIFQINNEISDRYLIRKYTKEISQFSKENKILQISSAKAGSLDRLALELETLNFQKIDKISYIKVLSARAAAK